MTINNRDINLTYEDVTLYINAIKNDELDKLKPLLTAMAETWENDLARSEINYAISKNCNHEWMKGYLKTDAYYAGSCKKCGLQYRAYEKFTSKQEADKWFDDWKERWTKTIHI